MAKLGQVVRTGRTVVNRLRHPNRHVECRHCGANLDAAFESCPNCDVGVPAVYDLD